MQMIVMSESLLLRDQSQFKLEAGGSGGEIGGPSIFLGWNMGGLKIPKDNIWGGGGSSIFF